MTSLTPRLVAVCRELVTGAPNKEIAARLGLSEGTIKVYLHRTMAATGTSNRLGLSLWFAAREAEKDLVKLVFSPYLPSGRTEAEVTQ